jgi:hypothetical protein
MIDDVLKMLRKEEADLLGQVSKLRAAINVLAGKSGVVRSASANRTGAASGISAVAQVNPMRGKHLSAAHKKAIKDGLAKRKKLHIRAAA